ncbi:MAG: hypothetical protein NC223_03755 [Butyrivibrio sp.]|nr:hypothetical protein [Butyrivibrio sp.]
MSQEKIDKRKQSKGELLHNAKKQMRITTLIVAAVLVAAGAFTGVVCYNNGYKKGEIDGGNQAAYYYSALLNSMQSQTTGDGQTKADGETDAHGQTKADGETKGESETNAETTAAADN